MNNHKEHLFDYTVGNPPYQVDSSSERQTTAKNIFHVFYTQSVEQSADTIMIFPAGRWIQRSMKGTVAADAIYPTVGHIDTYGNDGSWRVFPQATIHDGVCVVKSAANNKKIIVNNCVVNHPGDKEIIPMTAQGAFIVSALSDNYPKRLVDRKHPVSLFGLMTRYMEVNKARLDNLDTSTDDFVDAYIADDKPGSAKRVSLARVPRDDIPWNDINTQIYNSYKVVTNQGGASKRPESTTYSVIEPLTAVGASWVVVGFFDTKEEANNYKKYLDTDFVRILLEDSKGGKYGKWGCFVPDLIDYTNDNPYINWSKPLDIQLRNLLLVA